MRAIEEIFAHPQFRSLVKHSDGCWQCNIGRIDGYPPETLGFVGVDAHRACRAALSWIDALVKHRDAQAQQ